MRQGLSVSEYGIQVVETGEVITAEDEEDVYRRLGYDFIPPELRENLGELEAARRGELPGLVDVGDLRGDLHAHSTWSADADNTLEEMARTARDRGLLSTWPRRTSHYLRDGRSAAQAEEIAALSRAARTIPDPARRRGQHRARRHG